jgi:hypothetical protein
MSVRLFAARGAARLVALAPEALYLAAPPAADVGPASGELLRGASPDAVLPGAVRIPLGELRRITAPVLGRTLDLAWGAERRRVGFPDRKSRDAALEALESALPGATRRRDRLPRAVAALPPALAGLLFAADGLRATSLRWLVDAAGLALSLLWLGVWLWRPPDRIRVEAPPPL